MCEIQSWSIQLCSVVTGENMKVNAVFVQALVSSLVLAGCGAQSKLSYSSLPKDGAEGVGFPFVIPRTVVKVDGVAAKNGNTDKVTFTTVPVAYAEDGKTSLPRYLATDDSNAFSLTTTTVTSVTYADDLIISSIGSQVADNRKDAIDAVVGIASLAGAFAAGEDCSKGPALKPFVIDNLNSVSGRAPNNDCWGYSIKPADFAPVGMRAYSVDSLSNAGQVSWFPIAACRPYVVTVFRCNDADCSPLKNAVTTSVISASDGRQYRRVPLPAKGKITLHPDFCQADITSDSVGTSDWSLLSQALSDVKAAKKK